ncbi:hypothetical protein SEVIR_1G309501v4 [Setaria viridis]
MVPVLAIRSKKTRGGGLGARVYVRPPAAGRGGSPAGVPPRRCPCPATPAGAQPSWPGAQWRAVRTHLCVRSGKAGQCRLAVVLLLQTHVMDACQGGATARRLETCRRTVALQSLRSALGRGRQIVRRSVAEARTTPVGRVVQRERHERRARPCAGLVPDVSTASGGRQGTRRPARTVRHVSVRLFVCAVHGPGGGSCDSFYSSG